MKLEEAIKQTRPFGNEIQKLMVNIQFTSGWLNSLFIQVLKPFDITPAQYNVLRILKGKHPGGYCNQAIVERMLDKSSNSTRIADKLLQKKLINRTEDPADRRLVDIRITPKGLKLIEEVEVATGAIRSTLKSFNLEKAKLMNEWLDELRSCG